MKLSSEDSLRLNVLVANAEAIRVDEGAMAVFGLQGRQELKVLLHPNCKPERYLGYVRELLSSVVLDSPGGYPVFLRRWTRMGQIDGAQLDRLLRLGEPEAIMAVVCSPGLTEELARRAWWCAPSAEHARRMLDHPRVAQSALGRELASYLIDYLPFETEQREMMESVRLVLQHDLISSEQRQRLWAAGRNRKSYRVGFLVAQPDALPEPLEARADLLAYGERLQRWAAEGNRAAALLHKLMESSGQRFVAIAADTLRRPADQEVASALLNAIGGYFASVRAAPESCREIVGIERAAAQAMASEAVAPLWESLPALRDEIEAMLFLAHVDEAIVTPIFARTDAVGTVMRARIEPVTQPILARLELLRRSSP